MVPRRIPPACRPGSARPRRQHHPREDGQSATRLPAVVPRAPSAQVPHSCTLRARPNRTCARVAQCPPVHSHVSRSIPGPVPRRPALAHAESAVHPTRLHGHSPEVKRPHSHASRPFHPVIGGGQRAQFTGPSTLPRKSDVPAQDLRLDVGTRFADGVTMQIFRTLRPACRRGWVGSTFLR